jgi:hypothetical protein
MEALSSAQHASVFVKNTFRDCIEAFLMPDDPPETNDADYDLEETMVSTSCSAF